MIQSSSIDEIVFHRLGFATLGCESFLGGISYRAFLGNCLRDYLANCYRGFLAIGLFAQIPSRHDVFFRWALNFLSRDASYMKKKKS